MIGIIGASGFIGRNLIDNISGVVAISIRDKNWEMKLTDAHVLINLIGKAHDHDGTASEADYYYANVDLTKAIFNEFRNSSAKLLIHFSSLAALEEIEANEYLTELDNPRPLTWYGKSKRAAEEWLMSQDLPSDKKLIILRPPMIHGPGDKGNLSLLFKFISKGLPYPLSSFHNSRSFISITNLVFFVNTIVDHYSCLESGIYHVSDDEPVSTNEIIQVMQKVVDKGHFNIHIPKSILIALARLGDFVPLPLNSRRLKKMTSNLLVSNEKLKALLKIPNLPESAIDGIENTVKSLVR
ncbi:NAD-dependent epimerase/dehydratase family protein [Sphingobacterium shayense]|uniref:NAD-dependent epimerase/dehydratase family protein n=1 Tax=Sphingobacterium shayense TaxID=626343 RepID=UPI0015549286|nr:NAD-dependent epimerase/dehydratase family protein [Sphingobacterium shayense]NQD70237.1 NAD-dependent epimerase/dehydratase family protein [Sphingobacterium shayense]